MGAYSIVQYIENEQRKGLTDFTNFRLVRLVGGRSAHAPSGSARGRPGQGGGKWPRPMPSADDVKFAPRVKAESVIGVSFSLHSTAPGKAMLAAMSDAEFLALRPRMSLARTTPNTITTWDSLVKEISVVRQSGIGADVEENSLGICAVSMALKLSDGEIAAISVPVPTQRFKAMRPTLEKLLLAHGGTVQTTFKR